MEIGTYTIGGSGTFPIGTIGPEKFSIQITATGLDAADAVVKVQQSNDNVNFVDLEDNSGSALEATLTPSPATTKILATDIGMSEFFQLDIDEGAATTGTLTFSMKVNQ